jgi:hypothetical protein
MLGKGEKTTKAAARIQSNAAKTVATKTLQEERSQQLIETNHRNP